MNKKLAEIKPYIKFHLQQAYGVPVRDEDVDALCNKGIFVSVNTVGNDYVLVSETRLMTREEADSMRATGKWGR